MVLGIKTCPLHWGSPGQSPARQGVEEPGSGMRGWAGGCRWAAWLPAPSTHPACPSGCYSHGLMLPKLVVPSDFFHADARQSWQLLGSRTARNVISKCICYIQILGGSGGGCSAVGSWCKGDGRGTPVPPARQLGSVSPDPLVPQPPGRFAPALSPPSPPRTPRLGAHDGL